MFACESVSVLLERRKRRIDKLVMPIMYVFVRVSPTHFILCSQSHRLYLNQTLIITLSLTHFMCAGSEGARGWDKGEEENGGVFCHSLISLNQPHFSFHAGSEGARGWDEGEEESIDLCHFLNIASTIYMNRLLPYVLCRERRSERMGRGRRR